MRKTLLTARPARLLALTSCGLAAFLGSCSNGGSGGSSPSAVLAEVEPNETTADALAMTLDRPATGDLSTIGDADLWSVALASGEVVTIQLEATRFDQDAWEAANNVARLTVFDADGTTKLLEHDYTGNTSDGWSWGKHDLDIPAFRAPADGTYFIQVTTDDNLVAGARYALKVTLNDLGTQQVEAEAVGVSGANDTVGTAETITPGVVRGFHVDDEFDDYSFTITGPTVVDFEMLEYRNGVFAGDDAYFDPEISLYDTDGTTVLASNDDTFFYDSGIHFLLETAGTYTLQVGECCGAGDAQYFLRFSTTSFSSATAETEPNDTSGTATAITYGAKVTGSTSAGDEDWFSFTGTAGDIVHLQQFDTDNAQGSVDNATFELLESDGTTPVASSNGGTFAATRALLTSTGTYYVRVTPDASPTSTTWAFRLLRYSHAGFEAESNDTPATADAFDSNGRAAGVIATAGDVDVFSFSATADHLVSFSVYAQAGEQSDGLDDLGVNGSTLDPMVVVRDADGNVVAKSDGSVVNVDTESITDPLATIAVAFVPTTTGTYTVEVTDTTGTGSSTHTYVLARR